MDFRPRQRQVLLDPRQTDSCPRRQVWGLQALRRMDRPWQERESQACYQLVFLRMDRRRYRQMDRQNLEGSARQPDGLH